MTSSRQNLSFPDYLRRKASVYLPELSEGQRIPESEVRDVFDGLQGSQELLRSQVVALQARNEELEAYAHTVAHDLKNPLAVIISSADTITHVHDLTKAEIREFLQQIRSTACEMNNIIDGLLYFAEVRAIEAPAEPLAMGPIVAKVWDRLNYMIDEHRAEIKLPEAWPTAFGYAPWIEEVWANYLSNALKYGGRPPHVELGASAQPNGMACFWIRDNGLGIPPEAWENLFTPFTQVNHAPEAGHGLGLSIVRHIVEKLGGQVGFESELGKGSLFFFTLPASCPLPDLPQVA